MILNDETQEQKEEQAEEVEERSEQLSLDATKKPSKKRSANTKSLAKQKINRQVASRGDQLRIQGKCSFCGNPLTMTEKLNAQDLEGVKGDYKAYLCDTCQTMLDAGKTVDLKTAVYENEDGSISNVSISELVAAQQTTKKSRKDDD